MTHTIENMTVRFFEEQQSVETNEIEPVEIEESAFAAMANKHGAQIEYERHTIRENGVSQICLTLVY